MRLSLLAYFSLITIIKVLMFSFTKVIVVVGNHKQLRTVNVLNNLSEILCKQDYKTIRKYLACP